MIKETKTKKLKITNHDFDMGQGEDAHTHDDIQWYRAITEAPYMVHITVTRLMNKEEQKEWKVKRGF